MAEPVTDPDLLAQLNAPEAAGGAGGFGGSGGAKPVTDPKLLAELNGGAGGAGASGDAKKASVLDRVGTGMVDPLVGSEQLLSHVFGEKGSPFTLGEDHTEIGRMLKGSHPRTPEEIDKAIVAREKEIKKERGGATGVDWARVAGNVLSPVNLMMPAPARAGTVARAAITGAEGALAAPVAKELTGPAYVQKKAMDALWGTAFGAALGGAGSAVAPKLGATAQKGIDAKLDLTPGQMAGGYVRRAEEIAKSFPILGHFIRGAETRSLESFNASAINQALAPIGETLPSAVKPGRGAIDYANARLSAAYDQLLPQVQFSIDQQFATDMSNLRTLVGEMPKAQAEQFETIINNRLGQRLQPAGTMDGQTLKQVESELGSIASQYRGSSDAAQRQLASAIDEAKMTVRKALERQNPEQAAELQKINSAYAMFTRLQGAASRRAGSEGVFTPLDLVSAVRSGDKSVRKGDFARGDALMQEFAEVAQHLLPSRVPDSGTAERILHAGTDVGGGIAGYAVNPQIPIGLGIASLPYTQLGGKAARAYAQPGPARRAAGEAAKLAAPRVAPGASEALDELGIAP